MDDDLTPSMLRRIDYSSTFRFSRLFSCFRMAITPSRLVLALSFIVAAWLVGLILDGMLGEKVIVERRGNMVVQREWEEYRADPRGFDEWREPLEGQVRDENREGVFQSLLSIQQDLFQSMVAAAIGFRPGFDQLHPAAPANDQTVIGSIRLLTLTLPSWLWHTYPLFVVIYALVLMLLWALLGGAISRQMVVSAAVDRMVPMSEAVAFAARRWLTFLIAPLYPLLFILVLGAVLGLLYGWMFHIPVVNWLAGLLYVVALAIGWVMALLLVLWFAGVHLIYPAISAQGADALDAMARSFSYVMSRPWRLFLYSLIALLYGAATYLFVGLFIYLMLALAHWGTNLTGGLDNVFEAPRFGQWPEPRAEPTSEVAAFFIEIWTYLLIAGLGAYALSYYLAAYSQIYLLLRQHTDGDDPADVYEPQPPQPPVPEDKIEPVPSSVAAPVPPPAAAPDLVEDVEPQADTKSKQ